LREKRTPYSELNDAEQAIVRRNSRYVSMINMKRNEKDKIKWDYLCETQFYQRIYQETNTPVELRDEGFLSRYNKDKLLHKEQETFDTTPIRFADIPAGWDGFIDREGNFYKTKPIGASYYMGTAFCHMEFAIQYLKEQGITTEGDEKDYLIDKLGWCDYAHMVLSGIGVSVNIGEKLTKQQEKTFFKLFELNNDDMKKYYSLLDLDVI